MNGPIGKQMVDTLVESSSNVEVRFVFKFPIFAFIYIHQPHYNTFSGSVEIDYVISKTIIGTN